MARFLLVIILSLLSACSKQVGKTNAILEISSSFIVSGQPGGTMLYLVNKDAETQKAVVIESDQTQVTLANGNWDFVVLSWSGPKALEGSLRCGKTSANLVGGEASVSLTLTTSACLDEFYSHEDFRSNSTIKELKLVNCVDVTGLSSGQYCDDSARGFAGSYRINVLGHSDFSVNSLPNFLPNDDDKIKSSCFNSINLPSSVTSSGAKIPIAPTGFKLPVLVEVFEQNECLGEKKEFFFPGGISTSAFGGNSTINASAQSSDLYLEFGKVYVEGSAAFGQRLINQSSNMTILLKNSSSSLLSDFSVSIASPFSIQTNSCSGGVVPKKGSCSIVLDFNPTELSSFSQDLVFNFKKENVPLSLSQAITGTGVNNISPIAIGFEFGTVSEDVSAVLSLPFTDSENDIATSCAIESTNHLTVLTPCSCGPTGCYVSVKGEQDYYGPAFLNYSVVTNGVSSNISTASIIFSPEDDAPVLSPFNPPATDEDLQSLIMLSYFDVENNPATSCSIQSTFNVTVTQACTCTSGICIVGLTGTPEFSGVASFSYSVNANGLESNIQSINYSIMAVDDAPIAPALTQVSINEDTPFNAQLPFTDAEGNSPGSCTVTNVNNLQITTSCSCFNNICSVGMIGNQNFNGVGQFNYTIYTNGISSNIGTFNVTVNPVNDAPVITSVTPSIFNEDIVTTLSVTYSDPDNELASNCHIQSVTSLSIITPCTCTSGQCSMQVKGSPDNFNGYSYMSLNVTTNGTTSQSYDTQYLINSVDDAPVVANLYPTDVFEDTLKTISFNYTDADGPLGAICNLSAPTNTIFVGPCTCSGTTCTASFKSIQNYNGAGSFNYSVTTNNVTSNVGTVSYYYQAVDDAPIATSVGFRWVNPEYIPDATVDLKYSDPENSIATSCSIKQISSLASVGSCNCDGGICTGTIPSNQDEFLYTVTVQGLESNLGYIRGQYYYPNFFEPIPFYSINASILSNNIKKLFYFNNKIYVATTSGGVSISEDGGINYKTVFGYIGMINDIYIDSNFIYMATNNGVKIVPSSGIGALTTITTGLPSNTINDIFVDSYGRIFVATDNGVAYSNQPSSGSTPSSFTSLNAGLGSLSVNTIFVDNQGRILAGTSNGLSIAASINSNFSTYSTGLSNSNIRTIEYDPINSKTYVGTNAELAYLNNGGTSFNTLLSGQVNDLKVLGDNIHVALDVGYQFSTNSGSTFTQITQGLIQSSISSIAIDGNNNIYASTSHGLAKKTGSMMGFILTLASLGVSNNILVDNSNKIIVSTNNGLAVSENHGRSFRLSKIGLPSPVVSEVLVLDDGMMFVATTGGLAKSTNGGLSFVAIPEFLNINIKSITIKNGVIYLATSQGVYKSTNWGMNFTNHTNGLGNLTVNSISVDSSGTIYAATNDGLSVSTNGGINFTNLNFTTPIVKDVLVYGDYILVSTDSDFFYLSSNDLTSSDYVSLGYSANGITVDQAGLIYASTSVGLIQGTLNGGFDFVRGIYNSNLPTSLINGSPFVTKEGSVYVATSSGPAVSLSNAYLYWVDTNNNPISDLNLGNYSLNSPATDFTAKLKNFGNVAVEPITSMTVSWSPGYSIIQTCSTIYPNSVCDFILSLQFTSIANGGTVSPATNGWGTGYSGGDFTYSQQLNFSLNVTP